MRHKDQNTTNNNNVNEDIPASETENSNAQQEPQLTDEELQAEYRRRHIEQMRRFQCPGCGETDIF